MCSTTSPTSLAALTFSDHDNNSSLNSDIISSSGCKNNLTLTSHISSNDTSTNVSSNLDYVDKAVREIMGNENNDGSIDTRKDLMNFVMNTLYEQIDYLKDHITFLKAESMSKSSTIGHLFDELTKCRDRVHLNSSMMLDELMNITSPKKDSPNTNNDVINLSMKHTEESNRSINICTPPQNNSINSDIDDAFDAYSNAFHRHDELRNAINDNNDNTDNVSSTTNYEHTADEVNPVRKNLYETNIKSQLEEIRKLKHAEFMERKMEKLNVKALDETISISEEFGTWEKYNRGFASRYMKKMGYEGRGIGKLENGIVEPIMPSVNRGLTSSLLGGPQNLNLKERVRNNYVKQWPKGTTLITGDSILYGVQEKRLKSTTVRWSQCG